jgi:hypothetical protein
VYAPSDAVGVNAAIRELLHGLSVGYIHLVGAGRSVSRSRKA